MSIAVIIPLYNGRRWIRETLGSVFAQEAKPEEVVFVDDGSTDGSQEAVKRYPEVVFLQNPKKGATRARNFGFFHTRSDFVAFLDQDDLWHPKHLRLLRDALEDNPDAACAVAQGIPFQDGSKPRYDLSASGIERLDPWAYYPMHGLACSPSSSLFRREALEAVGGWPEAHCGMSDYSLWLRLSANAPMIRLRARTGAHRQHSGSRFYRLRSDDFLGHLRLGLRVTDDAFSYRFNLLKDDKQKEKCARRRCLAHDQYHLIEGVVRKDWKVVREMILRQEERMACEEGLYLEHAMRHLYHSIPNGASPAGKSHPCLYHLELLTHWPKEARRTYRAMLRVIIKDRPGANFYFKYYFARPWEISRFGLLFSAALKKLPRNTLLRTNHARS